MEYGWMDGWMDGVEGWSGRGSVLIFKCCFQIKPPSCGRRSDGDDIKPVLKELTEMKLHQM